MLFRSLAIAALIAAAAPALAQAPQSTSSTGGLAAPTPTKVKPKPVATHKVICKITSETGSRLTGNRICLPESEWRMRDEETRELTDQVTVRAR